MKLDEYLGRHAISPPKFAARVGIDPSTLWRIRKEKFRPEWKTMDAIARETDGEVMPNDFVWEKADGKAAA